MRYRLHLESRRAQSSAFHLNEAAWREAARRHPQAAASVDVSFGWDGETLVENLRSAEGLVASKFDKRVVNEAPRLGWVHTTGAGVDQLLPLGDLRADLVLTNSSGIHSDKAAEFATMALLMLSAGMPALIANQHARRWHGALTSTIAGKRVLVIGFGDIGQAVARAARTLGTQVTGLSRSGRGSADLPDVPVLPITRLDELLPSADFLVVTAPLTPETRDLVGARRLASMHPGACIVNMARAPLVDYDALAHLLRGARLGGAVLDVFAEEPLPEHSPLWSVPGLIVTPHVSCDSPDYNQRVLDLWFRNFERLQSGEPLHNRIQGDRGY